MSRLVELEMEPGLLWNKVHFGAFQRNNGRSAQRLYQDQE